MAKQTQHEIITPNKGFPFKAFWFEGAEGNYIRYEHWHQSIEIFAVQEGDLYFCFDEKKLLNPGDFVIVNSNEVHSVHAPHPNHTMVLQIPLQIFEPYFTADQFVWFTHSDRSEDEKLMKLLEKLFRLMEQKSEGFEYQMTSVFYDIVYLLVTAYRKHTPREELLKSRKQLIRLSEITSYIKDHYQEDLSLEGLAQTFSYSPAYLSRMFKNYAKVNFKDYLRSVRLDHAYNELTQTDREIGEIAINCGFASSKAFSNLFRERYGMLPSEFRKASMN